MPLNISGSIVNSEIVEELDKKSFPTRNLEFYIDPGSPDCYNGMQNWGDHNTKNLAHSIGSIAAKSASLATGMCYQFDGSNDWIESVSYTHLRAHET